MNTYETKDKVYYRIVVQMYRGCIEIKEKCNTYYSELLFGIPQTRNAFEVILSAISKQCYGIQPANNPIEYYEGYLDSMITINPDLNKSFTNICLTIAGTGSILESYVEIFNITASTDSLKKGV